VSPNGNSKQYLNSIGDYVLKHSPQIDAIIDLGSEYIFDLLRNKAEVEKLHDYFGLFENATKNIPYKLAVRDIPESLKSLGIDNEVMLTTKNAQIRFFQNYDEEDEDELFPQWDHEFTKILFSNKVLDKTESQNGINVYHLNEIFSDQISKIGVSMVITGSNTDYSRDFPALDGSRDKNKELHVFEYKGDYTTYININGSNENHAKSNVDVNTASNSGIPSFGVLTINQDSLKFELITEGHIQMDYVTIKLEDNNEDSEGGKINFNNDLVSPMFRYMVYLFLMIWIIGFSFFIINWIRWMFQKPPSDGGSDGNSDEEAKSKARKNEFVFIAPEQESS
jgi:hypothetical protein